MIEWRWIVGYEGLYEVSSDGQVRSFQRDRAKGRMLRSWNDGKGYPRVKLCREGKKYVRAIHQIVAEAFLGPCPIGMEVLHGPQGPSDSSLANLHYGTHVENCFDRVRDGTMVMGEQHYWTKLREVDVRDILEKSKNGRGTRSLAREYGVSRGAIQGITTGKTWKSSPVRSGDEK